MGLREQTFKTYNIHNGESLHGYPEYGCGNDYKRQTYKQLNLVEIFTLMQNLIGDLNFHEQDVYQFQFHIEKNTVNMNFFLFRDTYSNIFYVNDEFEIMFSYQNLLSIYKTKLSNLFIREEKGIILTKEINLMKEFKSGIKQS